MATKTAEKTHNVGKVVQVIGPVLDVEFEPEHLPELYNAITVALDSGRLVAEVEQHIGRNQIRAVAMSTTDGVVRGMDAVDTGQPITVPVGKPALGRILNVIGEPVDEGAPIAKDAERWPIHRGSPKFVDLEPKTQVFETGIKASPTAPLREGRQDRAAGGAGVGDGRSELINNVAGATASRSSAASVSGRAEGNDL
jgi:F-type H+-transporting ATPase subunit beta